MRSLLSLPAFVGSFVVASLAFLAPTQAHAQFSRCRISPFYPLILHNDCPDEMCNISLNYIVVLKIPCEGCCLWGTATLTCDTGTSQHNLNLCADCGETNTKDYFCPSTPGFVAETVILSCRDECI